jgi:hypothetical protein
MKICFLLAAAAISSTLVAEPVCHKCEVVREYNKEHPSDGYEYLEDYKDAKSQGKIKEQDNPFIDKENSAKNSPVPSKSKNSTQ